MAPRIRRHSHLRWCRSHGSDGKCLLLYRYAHVCSPRQRSVVYGGADADPAEKAEHGDGYACCNGVLARSCYGVHTGVCEDSG